MRPDEGTDFVYVFNRSVVNYVYSLLPVSVRMRIYVSFSSVGSPARVSNTYMGARMFVLALSNHTAERVGDIFRVAGIFGQAYLVVFMYSDNSGGVISTIL